MELQAALIQFPEASALSLVGIAVVLISLTFALFGNDYFKKASQKKAVTKMQHKAVREIYQEKNSTLPKPNSSTASSISTRRKIPSEQSPPETVSANVYRTK